MKHENDRHNTIVALDHSIGFEHNHQHQGEETREEAYDRAIEELGKQLERLGELLVNLTLLFAELIGEFINSEVFEEFCAQVRAAIMQQNRVIPRPPKVIKPTVRAPYIPILPRARSRLNCPCKHRLFIPKTPLVRAVALKPYG